jgi:hypothetical protein
MRKRLPHAGQRRMSFPVSASIISLMVFGGCSGRFRLDNLGMASFAQNTDEFSSYLVNYGRPRDFLESGFHLYFHLTRTVNI